MYGKYMRMPDLCAMRNRAYIRDQRNACTKRIELSSISIEPDCTHSPGNYLFHFDPIARVNTFFAIRL